MSRQLAFGFKGTLFSIFIWLIIGFSIIIAVTYKSEITYIFDKTRIPEVFSRVSSEIYPSKAFINETGEVRINKGAANQYLVEGKVNSETVLFLVDTGATNTVLTLKDAIKAGINIDKLNFRKPIRTANGINYSAPILVKSLEIGNIQLKEFNVLVLKDGLFRSLLGMDFISKLSKFKVENNVLILKD